MRDANDWTVLTELTVQAENSFKNRLELLFRDKLLKYDPTGC